MTEQGMWRERAAWMAAVAVLATVLAWVTVLYLLTLPGWCAVPHAALVAARALGGLALHAWSGLPHGTLCGMMLALAASEPRYAKGKVRHE
jgi:hypothetical protein